MLEKASLIIQSEDYSRNKKKDKAIETAILNIANKIKIDNQLTNKDVYLATNILLKVIPTLRMVEVMMRKALKVPLIMEQMKK